MTKIIESFVLEDKYIINGDYIEDKVFIKNTKGRKKLVQKFEIQIPVDILKDIAFAICDLCLEYGKEKYDITENYNELL